MTIEEIYHIISLLWLCFIVAIWAQNNWLNIIIKVAAICSAAAGAVVVAMDMLR